MDYTTAARVKAHLRIQGAGDDALLAVLATAASRAIDRKCTQSPAPEAVGYFALETRSETLRGLVDGRGVLQVWPHKPDLSSVESLAYRHTPLEAWLAVATERLALTGGQVEVWPVETLRPGRYAVQMTYTGGYGADVDALPADLVEAATVLAARYYREAETGLTDAMGIAEIGQLVYTKAMPARVEELLQPFVRRVPW